jgi:HYR domain
VNTIRIDGSANPLQIVSSTTTPNPINNQTDVAGIQTITAPRPTIWTEPIATANVLQGKTNHPFYAIKIEATTETLVFDKLKIKTIGTYTASDLTSFQVFKSNTNSFASATYLGYHGQANTGNGQTLNFAQFSETLPLGESRYYFFTCYINPMAVEGHTFKVDGSANPTEIGGNTTPIPYNNQTDIAGIQTIVAPKPTIWTEPIAAANVLQGKTNHPIYAVKIEATSGELVFNGLDVKLGGTFNATDLNNFQVFKSNTNSYASATNLGYHGQTITGTGQTITLRQFNEIIPSGESRYYFITANIAQNGVEGNTIKVDGSINPVQIIGYNSAPIAINNQTDIAGEQTIVAPKVTYTTEPIAAANVLQGTQSALIYSLKIAATTHTVSVGTMTFNITGNYTTADVGLFQVWTNTINTLTGATNTGSNYSNSTGTGESFFQGAAATIPVGESRYFFLTAQIKQAAVDGHTIKVNGSANPVDVDYNSTNPIITNDQTDIAGIQTIKAPLVTYSSETVPPLNVLQGTQKVLLYTLKLTSTSDPIATALMTFKTTGNYTNSDIGLMSIYINSTNSLTGATPNSTNYSTSIGTGETITLGAQATIPVGESRYFFIIAEIRPAGTNGRTIKINGAANPIEVIYNYVSPIITNNQTNIAGNQTIGTPSYTASTENVAAKIIARGTNNHPFYILKIQTGAVGGTITNLKLNTAGTYDNDDISSFTLYQNTSASATGATLVAIDNTSTGHGETLDFNTGYLEIDANTTTYLIVEANINPSANALNTFQIIGTSYALAITNSGLASTLVNNQTNVAGIQTIGIPPAFPTLANISQNTDNNLCSALVNFTATATGTPTPTYTYVLTGASLGSGAGIGTGLVYPKGITKVQITATNACAPNAVTSFDITINDAQKPTITAPGAVSVFANSGCYAANVALGTATATDNCTTVNISINAPANYALGQTIVTYTATDGSGNNQAATQIVTVIDNTPPTITAPASVSAFTNAGCTATGVVLGSATSADNCTVVSTVNNAPTVFPLGTTTVTWTVTDGAGLKATATQTVTVTDNVPPTITAPAPVSAFTNTGCTATGVVLGSASTNDNCSVATTTNNAPTAFPLGATTVTWTVTDGAGLTSTATQIVTVTDNVKPAIPTIADATGSCSVTPTAPTTTDNCAGTVSGSTSTTFPITTLGTTVITWTFNDGNGNSVTANQNAIVTDLTPPTITAPAAVSAFTNSGCTATGVALGTATSADNCTVVSTVNNAPTIFPLGATTVTWTVTDGAGLKATAIQTVTVTDIVKPVTPTLADINSSCISFTPTAPATTDNCAGTIKGTTTTVFPIMTLGTTVVTWLFNDGHGNVTTANQNIIITESIAIANTVSNYLISTGANSILDANCKLIAKITPGSLNGEVSANVWVESALLPGPNLARHYQITADPDLINPTAIITLFFTQAEFDTFNITSSVDLPTSASDAAGKANLRIQKFSGQTSSGLGYTSSPIEINPDDTKIIYANNRWEVTFDVTGFSGFFVNSVSTPLPLTLLSFTGKQTAANENTLTWKTASEIAFDRFEINKSIDAKSFEKIGEIKGSKSEPYEFIDASTVLGKKNSTFYYRLKMIDLDGSFAYSKIIKIENEFDKIIVGNFYPNPNKDNETFIDIETLDLGNWTIKSYSQTGQLLNAENRLLKKGINIVKIDLGSRGEGIRYIQFESKGVLEVRKIVQQ